MTHSQQEALSSDVLIIGGGPVGLALCLDLALRGVRSLLVEKRGPEVSVPKMNMVNGRSMEFVRRWGLAEKARAAGAPSDVAQDVLFCTSLPGYELARFPYPSYKDRGVPDYSPEASWRISQMFFDPLLVEAASAHPKTRLMHWHNCVEVAQSADGVTARIKDKNNVETQVSADYLVACDGAESEVRKYCDIAMEGSGQLSRNVNFFFTCEDLVSTHNKGHAWANWLVGPEGYWGLVVAVDSRTMWRMSVRLPDGEDTVSEATARSDIQRAIGDAPYQLKAILPWVRRQLVAQRYRSGRFFLAGDACHVMSPTGGLGMNTGLGDAMDLSWKLAATLQGWGGDKLLDSYERERRNVAIANSTQSSTNFGKLTEIPAEPKVCAADAEGEAARARIREHILTGGYDDEYEQEGSVYGYSYLDSPVIAHDGATPPGSARDYVPSDTPGARAPHLWLDSKTSIIDRFWSGPTLVLNSASDSAYVSAGAAADAKGLPLNVIDITRVAQQGLYTKPFTLVRPDGHVAWRGEEPSDWSDVFSLAFPH